MPLDIITNDDRVEVMGDRMQLIHQDINDISIYEKFGAIRRVPVEAIKPYENEPTISEPVPMPNYSALMNEATGDMLKYTIGYTMAGFGRIVLFTLTTLKSR